MKKQVRKVEMTLGEAWRMDNGGLVRTVWCPGRSEPQPVMGGGRRQLEHRCLAGWQLWRAVILAAPPLHSSHRTQRFTLWKK